MEMDTVGLALIELVARGYSTQRILDTVEAMHKAYEKEGNKHDSINEWCAIVTVKDKYGYNL